MVDVVEILSHHSPDIHGNLTFSEQTYFILQLYNFIDLFLYSLAGNKEWQYDHNGGSNIT